MPRVCDVFGSTTILVIGCPLSVTFLDQQQGSFMVSHGFWLVSMVLQGSFMGFHGFWLVSMVFQGSYMVFGRFSWFFKVVSWFLVGFHGFSR